MVLGMEGGETVAEGTGRDHANQGVPHDHHGEGNMGVFGPPTPDTLPLQEHQIEQQMTTEGQSGRSHVAYIEPEPEGMGEVNQETGATEQDVVDVDQDEEHQQTDDVVLMQNVREDFETILQRLLVKLDDMGKAKAARLSAFLQQMMMDQRRNAPHLRNPGLGDRYDRLSALIAVFHSDQQELRGDEEQWCLTAWQELVPYLENKGLPEGINQDRE